VVQVPARIMIVTIPKYGRRWEREFYIKRAVDKELEELGDLQDWEFGGYADEVIVAQPLWVDGGFCEDHVEVALVVRREEEG